MNKKKTTMKRRATSWLSWRQAGQIVVVVLVFISMAEPVTLQSPNRNNNMIIIGCSRDQRMSPKYFLTNLNTTLSSLHQQLTNGSRYAFARTLFNGESVWALATCPGYVSTTNCVSCFNYAVTRLKVCGLADGATSYYDDCNVRYENHNFSYTEPYGRLTMGMGLCGNITAPQPIEFQKTAKRLLLDLQIATPRAYNYYAASVRKVVVGNATVYAIAQCNINVSQNVCLECLKKRYRTLYACLPITSGQAIADKCLMRYDVTSFFGKYEETYITSLLEDGRYSRKKKFIMGLIVGGVSILLLVLAFFIWCCIWKKTGRCQNGVVYCKYGHWKLTTIDAGVVYHNYRHLRLATNNFSEENIIGKGGFGEVFKAILDDKKVVAVKKLKVEYARAKVGFENEILLTSQIRHRNLLSLLGWSTEGCDLLLVLEYIPNGSLDKFLWGVKRGDLKWKTRYDIILGIARGLAHLHKEFHVKIVHRDIKSSNILVDDDFQPKIADFGLARFQPENQSHVTTKFAGTLGYTAPEYVLYGHLSDKVDTFSFGIVMLEIVSGRKCTYRNFDGSSTDGLLEYAWKLYETKNLMKLVDKTMDENQYKEEHMMNIIEIALLCTQSPASKRPTMSEVVLMLSNNSSLVEIQLTRPNFIDHDWRIQFGSS